MLDSKNFPFLPISEGNSLVKTDSKRSEKRGMDNDDDYYNEVNPEQVIVASYHVWNHMSIYPPQRVDEGWEKYDLDGKCIASGKCQ